MITKSHELSTSERELIFRLAEGLTGACHHGKYRRESLVANVAYRMNAVGASNLASYLTMAEQCSKEHAQLVSALTIHTTHWFRESPHYQKLWDYLTKSFRTGEPRQLRLWSAGCSTGQEAWSYALVLEKFRREHRGFDYEVVGTDIDPTSIEKARHAVYSAFDLIHIPKDYHSSLCAGSGKAADLIALAPEVRQRCKFFVDDLTRPIMASTESFDVVSCRNVLIYFSPEDIERMIDTLCSHVTLEGVLITGHAETFQSDRRALQRLGNAVYKKTTTTQAAKSSVTKTAAVVIHRVMVVDDSKSVGCVCFLTTSFNDVI